MPVSANTFFVFVFLFQFSFFTYFNFNTNPLINLTPYSYPKRQGNLKDNYYQITIMGRNDFHGDIFPEKFEYQLRISNTRVKGGNTLRDSLTY